MKISMQAGWYRDEIRGIPRPRMGFGRRARDPVGAWFQRPIRRGVASFPGRTNGFTLLELLVVIAVGLTVTAISMIVIQGSLRNAKVDGALQLALGQIRQVHERAIDERHIYRLTFVPPRTIQTDRIDMAGSVSVPVFVGSIELPTDMSFTIVSGTPAGTTPNGFGAATNAIDLSVNNVPGVTEAYFQPDGQVLDPVRRIANGIVYMARPGDLTSSRAITVFGATGRVKGWKLLKNGTSVSWGQL